MSTVQWSIVAPARTQTADPAGGVLPGWPLEVIDLLRNEKTTTGLGLATPESADVEMETTFGDKVIDARAKRRVVLLSGLLDQDQYARLAQLREDSRQVYLSPNFDRSTILCTPLFGSMKSLAGPDMSYSQSHERFQWDADRQVLHSIGIGNSPIGYGGPFGRFGRPQSLQFTNRAAVKHPTSSSTGWTVAAGGGSVSYNDDHLTPVLSRRHTVTERGVTVLDCVPGTINNFQHAASSLTSGGAIGAVTYIMAETSGVNVSLLKADGSQSGSGVNLTAQPGTWQRVEIQGSQSAAGTTADLQILATDTGAGGNGHTIRVGPVFIGNVANTDAPPDWVDTALSAVGETIVTDGMGASSRGLTMSCVWRVPPTGYTGDGVGLIGLGTGNVRVRYEVAADLLRFDPTGSDALTASVVANLNLDVDAGDWVHMVCTSDATSRAIWINGTEVATASGAIDGGYIGDRKRLGSGGSSGYVCDAQTGMCLVRVDNRAWTDAEIARHYQTFGRDIGRAVVRQVYGRKFTIAELTAEQFSVESDGTLFQCSMTLMQSSEGLDFAPIARTEAW